MRGRSRASGAVATGKLCGAVEAWVSFLTTLAVLSSWTLFLMAWASYGGVVLSGMTVKLPCT